MRILSTFSGCGGMDLGFIKAGHKVLWANDIDMDCVETYKRNIGSHIVCEDIKKVSSKSLPDVDLIIGGFPCQGFSCANLKRSKEDTRNELYLQLVRLIKEKRPRFFLAENVRGLLSLESGKVMDMIVQDFTEAGYRVKYQLFNVADFGVPQDRRRVIIIGTRKDIPVDREPNFPAPTHAKQSQKGRKPWVSIGRALASIPEPDAKHHLDNHICSKYKVTNRNFTGHRTTDPNKPSPTILARGNGKGGVCAIQHPNNHRRLSVRESAIIQTFPRDFVFHGSMGSMYRQIGNAVPVAFAQVLGQEFKRLELLA